MTLGERQGDEKNDSKYCGVETEFNDDMPQLLSLNIHGGFDFVVAPLVIQVIRAAKWKETATDFSTWGLEGVEVNKINFGV
ncbi:hypothetical protein KY284_032175 [Solanum tuberosum]|nr:hypothetical protein KY284_032175 [Solanum tuberosum]